MILQARILETIKAFDRIVICRHRRPDGDAYGSTFGLREILRDAFPTKDIRLINDDHSDYLSFVGDDDLPFSDEEYRESLFIVLDTGTKDRVSQKHLNDAKFLIKIDHHIDNLPYGDISWVEDARSSACEMIASFCLSFPETLRLSPASASYLFTGMVTDTGRFRYEGTDGDTMRIAGALMDQGIDREMIFANLYMDPYDVVVFSANAMKNIRRTENGVAYLHVTTGMIKKYGITTEQASASVSLMDSIRGSFIYIAFIDYPDATIRVRLRSRFIDIQKLASKYHGGGHANASGATLSGRKEMNALLRDADAILKEAKQAHKEWI